MALTGADAFESACFRPAFVDALLGMSSLLARADVLAGAGGRRTGVPDAASESITDALLGLCSLRRTLGLLLAAALENVPLAPRRPAKAASWNRTLQR